MTTYESTRLAAILDGKLDRSTVYRIASELKQPAFAVEYWKRQNRAKEATPPHRAPARYRWHQFGT